MSQSVSTPTSLFRTGYITSFRGDLIWFLGLPLFALAFAFAAQQWLSAVVLLSVALWIEYPHFFATFVRTYGLRDDWQQYKQRLIVGPIVLFALALAGYAFAPLTMTLLILLWTHQHFVMQLHGFTRIYDFKARAGSPSTGRWDFFFNWTVYVNMLLTAPLFVRLWIHQLYAFHIPISAGGVRIVQACSWSVTGVFLAAYVAHVLIGVRKGHAVNPVKYLFLALNYSVLYVVAFHTNSVLVHAVANMLIHGIQYDVIVYWYLRRKVGPTGQKRGLIRSLVQPGRQLAFALFLVLYGLFFQVVIVAKPLDEFAFGLVTTNSPTSLASLGIVPLTQQMQFEMIGLAILELPSMLHRYFDAFIWKVRDTKTQKGL